MNEGPSPPIEPASPPPAQEYGDPSPLVPEPTAAPDAEVAVPMSRRSSRQLPDPELDAAISDSALAPDTAPEVYLRLVANPFLALFALILWIQVVYAISTGVAGPFTLLALMLAIAGLALIPSLLHYHCLDCGRTRPIMAWRRHVCPGAVARRFEGRPRVLRGPTPIVQVILWLWLFAIILALVQSRVFPR